MTAAGPHAGGAGTGDVVERITWHGPGETLSWAIERHSTTGTVLGLAAVAVWFLVRRRDSDPLLVRAMTAVCVLIACQGAVGIIQWQLALPPELVWVHVVLATSTWIALLWAAAAAGRIRHGDAAGAAARAARPRARVDAQLMATVIVTGSGGLIGSEAVAHFARAGYDVVGIENDMRARFFGPDASTARTTERLLDEFAAEFRSEELDIRDADGVLRLFERVGADLAAVIHTAAQPSHDWAASDPQTDFGVNANGTLNLLEATRQVAPEATFIFTSTNKVYGDTPNRAAARRRRRAARAAGGPPRTSAGSTRRCRSTARCTRCSASPRSAADLMVQEYGRYFDMPTVCFRGGCLTGPQHAGAQLHGFLSLPDEVHGHRRRRTPCSATTASRCATTSTATTWCARSRPSTALRGPAAVYNLGGGRESNCSMREAIAAVRAHLRQDARLDATPTRPGWAITAGGSRDLSALPGATIRSGSSSTTSRRRCARSTTSTSSAGWHEPSDRGGSACVVSLVSASPPSCTGCSQQPTPELPTSASGLAWIGLSLVLTLVALVLRGWRWHRIMVLAGVDHRRTDAVALTAVAYMGNNVLPARGGEVMRIAILGRRSTSRRREILGSVVAERIAGRGGRGRVVRGAEPRLGRLAGRAGHGGAGGRGHRARVRRAGGLPDAAAGGRFEAFATKVRPVAGALRLFAHPSGLPIVGWSLVIWGLEGLNLVAIARSIGISLSPQDGLLVVTLAALAAAIPAAPGFAGTYDAALLLGLKAAGIAGGAASGILILSRLMFFGPPTVVGLITLVTRYGGLRGFYRTSRNLPVSTS